MIKKIALLVFCFVAYNATSQTDQKFFFETEYQLKFSVGNPSYQPYQVFTNLTVDLPKTSTYYYPVNSLNLSANYQFSNHFSAGLGFGFGFVKFEPVPLNPFSYYDKVLVPFYLRIRYNTDLKNNWFIMSDLDFGYQYTSNAWGFISQEVGFRATENGGSLLALNIGFGKRLKKFSPMFKLGYEFNNFKREYTYSYKQNMQPTTYQSVKFNTYYHLLKLGVSLKF